MTLRTSDDVKNAAVNATVDLIDVGSINAAGKIEFYTGTKPGAVGGGTAETLLASVDFASTAFGAAASGSASAASTPLATTGLADGTIGWARILDKDETVLWDDDDVGTSGTAIVVNTLSVSTGVDFEVTSYTFGINDPS